MKTRNSHGLLQLHVGREALAYCQCLYRENKALFVSVDLIGEKNQVILEILLKLGRYYLELTKKLKNLTIVSNQNTRVDSPYFSHSDRSCFHLKGFHLFRSVCVPNTKSVSLMLKNMDNV